MQEFAHIKSVIAIVLGLSLTHLIKGTVSFIQHPGRKKFYFVHFLWVLYMFLLLIHFWWWEFNLNAITEWYFGDYFFLICYILQFFILCALLYPDDLQGYDGYKDYFYSRRGWFFAVLALTFLSDIVDTGIKGQGYYLSQHPEYYVRNISHFLLCLVAVKVKKEYFHIALAAVFIIYEISFILRYFNLEA